MSVLLDAGPFLNFLAVRQQGILIELAASRNLDLAVPQRVEKEILGNCNDPRFARTPAEQTWLKLTSAGRVRVLDDTLTDTAFVDAVGRISGRPAQDRVRDRKSLGEILVLAHASVLVQQGQEVYVLIDEGDGRRRAQREIRWLEGRLAPARLTLWGTSQVLRHASQQTGWIRGGLTWQAVYEQMRPFDDGLPLLPPGTT
ncbi:MAG: hypothetical protein JNL54_04710 [Kineosporiaceae bacterium]|nr:hypothetical protein [Kineosporiaceae bacterium]